MSSFNQNAIKHKTTLLNLAAELGNVSKACKLMGFSRDTFYRYQKAVAEGGVEALFDANRKKPNLKYRATKLRKMPSQRLPLIFPLMARYALAMNCVKKGFLFPLLVCAPSGCGMASSP